MEACTLCDKLQTLTFLRLIRLHPASMKLLLMLVQCPLPCMGGRSGACSYLVAVYLPTLTRCLCW